MSTPTVYVVDDDAGVRNSVSLLLESAGFKVTGFASAEAFLQACGPTPDGCLLLDVRMPGMSGLQLQAELQRRMLRLPIIFLTAHADVPMTVTAMKRGAADFLVKPVNGALLLRHVQSVLEWSLGMREEEVARREFQARLQCLTRREREVLGLALAGQPNKEISQLLRISVRTVEVHRSRILLKTGAVSMMELLRQAVSTGHRLDRDLEVWSDAPG